MIELTNIQEVAESQTLAINSRIKDLQNKKEHVFNFGFGESPFNPPIEVLKSLSENIHQNEYTASSGILKLRNAIVSFYQESDGLTINPEDVIITPGSKAAIYLVLLSVIKADVLIATPCWTSYEPQVRMTNHNPIRIVTNYEGRWRITQNAMIEALSRKKYKDTLMILNYPGNPDGLTYTRNELELIGLVARANNIIVISDEIYGLLTFNANHVPFASIYPDGTITTTSLSKWCGVGGWRLGMAILPKELEVKLKKSIAALGSEIFSCTTTPMQYAGIESYSWNKRIKYIQRQREILATIGMFCYKELDKCNVKVHPPEGGFYLFLDFMNYAGVLKAMAIETSNHLCDKILQETGVALLSGTAFGMQNDHLTARLAYVDFEDPIHNNSIDLNRDCPKVVRGINSLTTWLKSLK